MDPDVYPDAAPLHKSVTGVISPSTGQLMCKLRAAKPSSKPITTDVEL